MEMFVLLLSGFASILTCSILLPILFPPLAALYLVLRLRGLPHRRYAGGQIYVELGGAQYSVPREILELYMSARDPRIEDEPGDPEVPRTFFCWEFALLVPRVFSRVVHPFDLSDKPPARSRRAGSAPPRSGTAGGSAATKKKSADRSDKETTPVAS